MNYKTFFIVLITILIAVTFALTAIKPDLHKTLIVYNSEYIVTPSQEISVEENKLPTIVQEPKKETTIVQKQTATKNLQTAKSASNIIKNTTNTKQVQKPTKKDKQVIKPYTQKEVKQETKIVELPKKTEETPTEKIDKIIQETASEKLIPAQKQEEEIQWNIWRSKIQNQIMADVNLPIVPQGIVFKFSFNVDKYGRISEVQTWSTTPAYTPYAIQYIAPVIRSYQGKSILNFPAGSSRITTNVNGGWKISMNEKYSTPQDYNDVEKIMR